MAAWCRKCLGTQSPQFPLPPGELSLRSAGRVFSAGWEQECVTATAPAQHRQAPGMRRSSLEHAKICTNADVVALGWGFPYHNFIFHGIVSQSPLHKAG